MAKRININSRSFRSRVEAHQNKIFKRNRSFDSNLEILEQDESGLVLGVQNEYTTIQYSKVENELDELDELDEFDTAYLFVLDPEDISELSFDEIDLVWEKRHDLCGSDRALAEIIAIKEILSGIVDSYQGWQSYINAPDVQEWRDKKSSSQDSALIDDANFSNKTNSQTEEARLLKKDINGLSIDELKNAWNNRKSSFGSIEAACETLACIRFLTGIDPVKQEKENYFLSHPAIKELLDLVTFENELGIAHSESKDTVIATNVEKKYALVRTQLRVGQTDFRSALISNYNGQCCITKCSELAVLDAAHIRPYSGYHSNTLDNGLLLRSDIHKLYDRFLLSIEPESLTVKLSPTVKDKHYLILDGIPINLGNIAPSQTFLEEHYSTFKRIYDRKR
ncbi:HNH endonuclease [Alishewanella sp. SMS8]|uniref:HNH endonuclease n=1 Tax=Alishewanella sp. SMS8 TaxID=2994676 RepID=UPI0027405E12|nr:HNH endonuclease signature motif containing protein [Alishewanella sp. SMS8]MDP5459602.1 HNH endonuclease signature motif containing protein [Alishewanella sp. SMS8]